MAQLIPLIWVLQDVGRAMSLSGGSGEVVDSKLLPVVGRPWLLVVVGPELLFPCWLSAGGCSWFLGAFPWSSHSASTSKNQQWVADFRAEILTCFSSVSPF